MKGRGLVLVVDDDENIRDLVALWLGRAGYTVELFDDGESCLAGLGRSLPDCVCLDLHLPGLSGIEILRRIKAHNPRLPVIMLTADTTVDTVVTAIQGGAYDYLIKPLDRTRLTATVGNAVERHQLEVRITQLEREVDGRGYAGMVAASPTMRRLFRDMDRVSASDITVLIHGESGTGKELVARGLHEASARRDGPFVAVNCAAIPDTLEASEFFGHEKGAFTGANQRRVGRIEMADGGTLFLDEVGELSLGLQAKLLRVLQERQIQRVGGNREITSDFRLIAATHRTLEDEVRAGRFREDLFFRIVVFELEVPPLRDRGDDIKVLAQHFLAGGNGAGDGPTPKLSPEALAALQAYSWPGNVRELQNAVEHARLVASDNVIRLTDLPARILGGRRRRPAAAAHGERASEPSAAESTVAGAEESESYALPVPELDAPILTLAEIERQTIEEALERAGGNLSEVVRQLGIGRTTLYRKLKRYGIRS